MIDLPIEEYEKLKENLLSSVNILKWQFDRSCLYFSFFIFIKKRGQFLSKTCPRFR